VRVCACPPWHPPSSRGGHPCHFLCDAITARIRSTVEGSNAFAWLAPCLACCRCFPCTHDGAPLCYLPCLRVVATRPHHFFKYHQRMCTSSTQSPIAAINGCRRSACCLSVSKSAIIHGLSSNSIARSFVQCFRRTRSLPFARMSMTVFTSANLMSSLNSRIQKSCVFQTSCNATLPVCSRLCWSTMSYFNLYNCIISSTGISFASG